MKMMKVFAVVLLFACLGSAQDQLGNKTEVGIQSDQIEVIEGLKHSETLQNWCITQKKESRSGDWSNDRDYDNIVDDTKRYLKNVKNKTDDGLSFSVTSFVNNLPRSEICKVVDLPEEPQPTISTPEPTITTSVSNGKEDSTTNTPAPIDTPVAATEEPVHESSVTEATHEAENEGGSSSVVWIVPVAIIVLILCIGAVLVVVIRRKVNIIPAYVGQNNGKGAGAVDAKGAVQQEEVTGVTTLS